MNMLTMYLTSLVDDSTSLSESFCPFQNVFFLLYRCRHTTAEILYYGHLALRYQITTK